jgi:hypothetical protein
MKKYYKSKSKSNKTKKRTRLSSGGRVLAQKKIHVKLSPSDIIAYPELC